ncbi:MAG: alpha-L-fucosidase [Armatimonadetes bacterium]|nr:alpha-L-fucosidase [Armatimonadota bacterium]MDE2207828.1 alpha-L-fucosidase [Armatimonadota bacterium]
MMLAACACSMAGAVPPPAPYGAIPSKRQLARERMDLTAFLHFNMNTFTDKEWGYGDENPILFHPTAFNPDQIVSTLKRAGFKGVILTCKHHDGFCLWPTKATDHSVTHSSWMNGKGNVVKAISDACHRFHMKFGVYLSPWDRNNAAYGTPAYLPIYREQLRELLTEFGPIFEVWFDGANGGDGYYGGARETRQIDRTTYYHWPGTWQMVRRLQPGAAIFSDVGPDLRWVGNESGYAATTCWQTYDPVGPNGGPAAPGDSQYQTAGVGTENGEHWMPAECDVSIRPGWFYHADQDGSVKSPQDLMNLYFESVGRGALLLLNVPPDRQGQLAAPDVMAVTQFGKNLRKLFKVNLAASARLHASNVRGGDSAAYGPDNLVARQGRSYWATDDGIAQASLTVDFGRSVAVDVIRLREAISLGQRIRGFAIDVWENSAWHEVATGASIGNCRLVRLGTPTVTSRLRLRITKSDACIALAQFGVYAGAGLGTGVKP